MKASVALSLEELLMLHDWYTQANDLVGNELGSKDDLLRLKLMTAFKHLKVVKEAMGEAVQTPEINLYESGLVESGLVESDLNGTNLNQPGLGDYKVADHEMPEPEESSRDVVRKAFEELQYDDDPNVVWCKKTTRYVYADCGNEVKNWNREYFFWLKGIQWMSNLKENDR